MMKRLSAYLISLLALTACNSSPDISDDNPLVLQEHIPVGFSPYVGNMPTTRSQTSGPIDNDILKQSGFGIFAYYPESTVHGVYSSNCSVPNFMYNQPVTYDNGKSLWAYSPLKYWPNDFSDGSVDNQATPATGSTDYKGKISFFAYAPFVEHQPTITDGKVQTGDATGVIAMTANNAQSDPIITYTLKTGTPTDNIDLLWGTGGKTAAPLSYTNAANLTVTAASAEVETSYCVWRDCTKQKTGQSLNFAFVHALSKIGEITAAVKLNDGETADFGNTDEEGWTNVTISEVTLSYTGKRSGSLNLATGQWTLGDDAVENTYTFNAGNLSKKVYHAKGGKHVVDTEQRLSEFPYGVTMTPVSIFQSNTDPDSYSVSPSIPMLFFFPGERPEITVTVEYTLRTRDNILKEGWTSVCQRISKTIQFDEAFGLNKSYTLNILLGVEDIDFTATINSWTDGTETPVDMPINEKDS